MGSKNRIAKYILPIILKDRKPNQPYVEPFVGGFNLIDKVDGPRIAGDSNEYLITLFKAIQNGFIPPDSVSLAEYKQASALREVNPLTAFIGFGCSYSGKWFGGYARGTTNRGIRRNYCLESKNNILNQVKGLKGIEIHNCNYTELPIPENSLIYCDPPYKGTTGYKDKFNHEDFYIWCREMKAKGHSIYISEYTMPDDFKLLGETYQSF